MQGGDRLQTGGETVFGLLILKGKMVTPKYTALLEQTKIHLNEIHLKAKINNETIIGLVNERGIFTL